MRRIMLAWRDNKTRRHVDLIGMLLWRLAAGGVRKRKRRERAALVIGRLQFYSTYLHTYATAKVMYLIQVGAGTRPAGVCKSAT
jgi:hypothetical protein